MNTQQVCEVHHPIHAKTQRSDEAKLLAPALNHIVDCERDNCNLSTPCPRANELLEPWRKLLSLRRGKDF